MLKVESTLYILLLEVKIIYVRSNSLKFRLVRIYHKGRVFKTTTYTEKQQFEV
jgi:hypothetical protein